MTPSAIEFDKVYKKFHKGERHDSLRDLVPYLTKKIIFGRDEKNLGEKDFWAIKDVSFNLKKGESLGIIGPNGAGKSTILKLLSGILRPNMGNIKIDGRLSALIEVGAGFHQDLTGIENIYLNGAILGMRRAEISRKLEEIVEFSGISEFIDTPVKRYSSGMYARLGFSIAAHVDPEILLIDEVLSVGDISFQAKCIKKMHEIIDRGTSVIFISHNLPSVIKLCQKTILLNKGEIHKFGETENVCRYYYNIYAESRKATDEGCFELVDIKMLSENQTCSSSFRPGDWAKLKITIHSRVRLSNLVLGFFIKKNDGTIVFDVNSDNISDKYFSFEEGDTKEIDLDFRVNLPEGTYLLGFHLKDNEKGFYFYKDESAEFYVTGPKMSGFAFLDINFH